jgi:hypothetical protein
VRSNTSAWRRGEAIGVSSPNTLFERRRANAAVRSADRRNRQARLAADPGMHVVIAEISEIAAADRLEEELE